MEKGANLLSNHLGASSSSSSCRATSLVGVQDTLRQHNSSHTRTIYLWTELVAHFRMFAKYFLVLGMMPAICNLPPHECVLCCSTQELLSLLYTHPPQIPPEGVPPGAHRKTWKSMQVTMIDDVNKILLTTAARQLTICVTLACLFDIRTI